MDLPREDRRLMGRYELGRVGSLPGLGIGTRVASFHAEGKVPLSQLELKRVRSAGCAEVDR